MRVDRGQLIDIPQSPNVDSSLTKGAKNILSPLVRGIQGDGSLNRGAAVG